MTLQLGQTVNADSVLKKKVSKGKWEGELVEKLFLVAGYIADKVGDFVFLRI